MNVIVIFLSKFAVALRFFSTVILLLFLKNFGKSSAFYFISTIAVERYQSSKMQFSYIKRATFSQLLLIFEFLLQNISFCDSSILFLINDIFLKNSKPFLKHVFCNTVLVLLQIVFKQFLKHDYANILKSIKIGLNLKQKKQKTRKTGR